MEEGAADYPIAKAVLSKINSTVIAIPHYKDVFNRPGQDFLAQKASPKLILAVRRDNYFYKGAPMCENYGLEHFYYSTQMMNCIYNCAYCYLQGLYPSANVVAFVNTEDYFSAIPSEPAYISISYDADIMALENLFGYAALWINFVKQHPHITLEVRTKSANFNSISNIQPCKNVILSWTISPQSVIDTYEEGAPSLSSRLKSVKAAIEKGWNVRLCMDPILPLADWKASFEEMLDQIDINPSDIYDISLGGFRMSDAQYKKLKRLRPDFPYVSDDVSEEAKLIIERRFKK